MTITPKGQPIFRLRAAGSDHEIGLQRGRQLARDIHRMWEWMESRLRGMYGLPCANWDEVAMRCEANLKQTALWLQEQIAGMSETSGVSVRNLLLMNFYGLIWSNAGNWCSSVAVRDTDAGPLLGQNLDIGAEDFYYAEEVHPRGAHATLSDAMLGMCWSPCGINDAGLAVGSSNLPAPGPAQRPWNWDGVSYHFLARLVLRNCGTVAEAIDYLRSLPPTIPSAGGYQLNLLDATGTMAVVDKTNDRTVVRQCEDGLNFTTNCALDEEFERWRLGEEPFNADGRARAARIRSEWRKLNAARPTRRWLADLLRSDQGEGCLCRWNERGNSRLSFLFSPVNHTMDLSNGPPNRTAYEHFEFSRVDL